APLFQLVMIPFRFLPTMASTDDSTMADNVEFFMSSSNCVVMSTSVLCAPVKLPDLSKTGLGKTRRFLKERSGLSIDIFIFSKEIPCLRVFAMGHSLKGIGLPSG